MSKNQEKLINALDKHLTKMSEKELEMVLRFVYSLEYFREVTA